MTPALRFLGSPMDAGAALIARQIRSESASILSAPVRRVAGLPISVALPTEVMCIQLARIGDLEPSGIMPLHHVHPVGGVVENPV